MESWRAGWAVLFVEHAVLRGHATDATVDHLHRKLLLLCNNLFTSFTLFFLEWLSILFCLLLWLILSLLLAFLLLTILLVMLVLLSLLRLVIITAISSCTGCEGCQHLASCWHLLLFRYLRLELLILSFGSNLVVNYYSCLATSVGEGSGLLLLLLSIDYRRERCLVNHLLLGRLLFTSLGCCGCESVTSYIRSSVLRAGVL